MVKLIDIMRENDLIGEVVTPDGGHLNRARIDQALIDDGYTLPLPNKVTFHLYQNTVDKMYLVTWTPALDCYWVEKLSKKA